MDDASIIVNSILEEGVHVGAKSLIVNSHLANKFSLGKDSFVNGVRLEDSRVRLMAMQDVKQKSVFTCALRHVIFLS
jgi:hypothetical protein